VYILIAILLFQNCPHPWKCQEKKCHFSVRIHARICDTPSTQHNSVEHGKTFMCKTLLLTMYGEFWVPVGFIQANGFIQFHLRWDRTRIAWKQTKKSEIYSCYWLIDCNTTLGKRLFLLYQIQVGLKGSYVPPPDNTLYNNSLPQ